MTAREPARDRGGRALARARSPSGAQRAVGRLLRLLRITSALSVADVSAETGLGIARIRLLESGLTSLAYGDALARIKAYGLCPPCFARHYRAAQARGGGEGGTDG